MKLQPVDGEEQAVATAEEWMAVDRNGMEAFMLGSLEPANWAIKICCIIWMISIFCMYWLSCTYYKGGLIYLSRTIISMGRGRNVEILKM